MTDGTERLDADDARARRLACSESEWSVPLLLEAGAGTGKTAVLVSRIVHWLLGPGWERAAAQLANPTDAEIAIRTASGVVAITFTEAAAAEMASRIASFLAALGKEEPPKELTDAERLRGDDAWETTKKRATHLLGAVDRLRIRTIHGFCHSLLAAHPAEAGLHPAFQVDAEGDGAERLLVELLEETLPERYQAGEKALLRLAELGHGPAELADRLRQLVAAGATADGLAKNPLAPERQQALLGRVGEIAGKMHRLLEPIVGKRNVLPATRVYEAAALLTEGTRQGEKKNRLRRVIALTQEDTDTKELADWSKVLETLGKWDKGKFSSNTEREWLGDREAELSRTASALRGLIRHLRLLDLDGLEALRAALQPALEELERRRRRFGFVSFDELQRFAVRLLEERPPIATSVRQEIAQLLVDEFQDTDALQCRLVERLALEGPPEHRPGLFLVGDPKQSIYGWRRADLAAYERFATRIVEEGGRREKLTVNFRSVPPILAEVERVLEPAFMPEPGVQPEFEPLTASEANRNRRGCDRDGREAVEHWVSWAEGEEKTLAPTAVRIEAEAIAADIASLRAGGGIGSWEECAILLRATGDLPHYLEALR
ncbi:MAG TPA: UvrD-helicase domain-containing protein, partial [Thermoanaerobaculia bacterium]|nr:UvrD-helicase domain-containing protein [Thermoanaerobaculia bacterium]